MFKHIAGWVNVTSPEGPVDPDYGQPGQIFGPGVDNSLPGYGRPDWSGNRPSNELPDSGGGHVWGALIRWLQRPQIDGGPPKPPGLRPIIPVDPGWGVRPPSGPPKPPGHWEPIDPGYGKPPLWGWVQIDNGLPEPPPDASHKPVPLPPGGARPDHELPGDRPTHKPTPPGGEWVPVDPDWGKPVRPCPPSGGKPHPPIWAWIPDRPDIGGKPHPDPVATTIYPSTVTVLASGGSGSVNITTEPAGGSWTVDPASVPDWVTLNPMTSQSADTNLVYTALTNTTGLPKQALIRVNTATLTINQGAV